MYKGKKFHIKPVAEVIDEIDSIPERFIPGIDRVFLADGDALVYPQQGLLEILERLTLKLPALTRVGSYASPNSLETKSLEDLKQLRDRKLRILYFGLESGDDKTLEAVGKGFNSTKMSDLAIKSREAGMKLSVTAILGLAGRDCSLQHARSTADWINRVNPEYFSLLTLFHRHNEEFVNSLNQCSHGELMLEAYELLKNLHPNKTILRSNHVSNFINLSGSYPKDRERLIKDMEQSIARARLHPDFWNEIPSYQEEYY